VTKNYTNPDAVFDTYAYPRGGAVLHMLRTYLGEDNWWRSLNHYLTKYANQPVETAQLRIAIEETTGQPMDWFFDEWVNGTDVPSYRFAWKTAQDSAGFPTQIRVRQSDVPPSFGMYVPMLIKFDQGESLVRVLVRGPTTETTLRLPARPKSIELNPLESVLADVKTEGWD
jgi:aminopeptidase N